MIKCVCGNLSTGLSTMKSFWNVLLPVCGLGALVASAQTNNPSGPRVVTTSAPAVTVGGQFLLQNELHQERVLLRKQLLDLELSLDEERQRVRTLTSRMQAQEAEVERLAADAARAGALDTELTKTRELMTKQQYARQDEQNRVVARERQTRTQLEHAVEERDRLAAKLDTATKELAALTEKSRKQEELIATMTAARAELGTQLEQVRRELAAREADDEAMRKRFAAKDELEDQLKESELQATDLRNRLLALQRARTVMEENFEAEREDIARSARANEAEVAQSRARIAKFETRIDELSRIQTNLEAKVFDTQRQLKANRLVKEEVDKRLAEALELKDVLAQKDKLIAQKDTVLAELNQRNIDLEKQNEKDRADFNQRLALSDRSVQDLLANMERVKGTLAEAAADNQRLRAELDKATSAVADAGKVAKDLRESRNQIAKLQNDLAAKDREIAAAKLALAEEQESVEVARQSHEGLGKNLAALEQQLVRVQADNLALQGIAEKHSAAQERVATIQSQLETTRNQLAKAEEAAQSLDALHAEQRRNWEIRAATTAAELTELGEKYAALEADHNASVLRVAALAAERDKLTNAVADLQTELDDHKRKLTVRVRTLEDLDDVLNEASANLDGADKVDPRDEASIKLEQLNEELAAAQAAFSAARMRNVALEGRIADLNADLEDERAMRELAESRPSTNRIFILETTQQEVATELSRAKEDLVAAQRARDDRQKRVAHLETSMRELQAKLTRTVTQRDNLQAKLDKRPAEDPELGNLKAQMARMRLSIDRKQQEADTLREELTAARTSLADTNAIAEATADLAAAEARNRKLQTELDKARKLLAAKPAGPNGKQAKDLQARLTAREQDLAAARRQLAQSSNDLAKASADLAIAREMAAAAPKAKALENQIASLREQIASHEAEAAELQTELDAWRKKAETPDPGLARLRAEVAAKDRELKASQTETAKLRTDLASATAALAAPATNTTAESTLQRQVNDLRAQLIARTEETAKLAGELKKAQDAMAALSAPPENDPAVATLTKKLETLTGELNTQKEQVASLESDLAAARKQADDWRKKAETPDPGLATMQKSLGTLRAQLAQRQQNSLRLQTELNRARTELAERSRLQDATGPQLAALSNQVAAITRARDDSEAQAEKLGAQLETARAELAELKKNPAAPDPAMQAKVTALSQQLTARDAEVERLRSEIDATQKQLLDWRAKASKPSEQEQAAIQRAASLSQDLQAITNQKTELQKRLAAREQELTDIRTQLKQAVASATNTLTDTVAEPAPANNNDPGTNTDDDYYELTAIGDRLLREGRLDEAKTALEKAIQRHPDLTTARLSLATVHLRQQDLVSARNTVNSVLAKDPSHPQALGIRALVIFQEGQAFGAQGDTEQERVRYEQAHHSVKMALRRARNAPELHNYQGIIATQLGKLEEAESALNKAIEYQPDFADAHFNLAVLMIRLGESRHDDARRHYEKALQLDSPREPNLEKILYK